MKWLIPFFILNFAWAQDSKVIPNFLEAVEVYTQPEYVREAGMGLKPEVLAVIRVLEKKRIDPKLFEKFPHLTITNRAWQLPKDDAFDLWSKNPSSSKQKPSVELPEISLHAVKLDVINKSDVFGEDDLYAYFFMTDGVIPTGKVTSIYKGINEGESFFLNEIDRAIFPLMGLSSKKIESHLIVDYGIIESKGDDIKELQKLSSIIIDIALAVYTAHDPQNSQILISLRKEIKALADLLLSRNLDNRLVTSSFAFKAQELATMLSKETFVEFKKNHKKTSSLNNWEYDLHFRLLRK